jgi:hypothetical protein
MPKPPLTRTERAIAERELLRARRKLKDLLDIYDSGNWRYYSKQGSFTDEIKRAKLAVDHWVDVCNGHRHDVAH